MKRLLLALWALATWGANAQPAQSEFWQEQSIYQIITDRFFDGDPSNNNADGNFDARRSRSPHGGDFRGIEKKLDYIKGLGVTAIWISPIVENGHGEYHGYAARNFLKVDPRWGTLEDLRRMVDAAHQRGLLVIDDIVVNHGGNLIDSGDPGYGAFLAPPDGYHLRYHDPTNVYPPPFDLNATNPGLTNLFHNNGLIHDYSSMTQVTLGELSGLDDFRTESPYVREQMERIYEYWIEAAGFDGFRIDTVKHVEPDFWKEWCPAVRQFAAAHGRPDFFMFGEVLDGSDKLCGSFTGTKGGGGFELDSVLDYPLYFKIQDVFAKGTASPAAIEKRYAAINENYDPLAQSRLVTFLDNHDQPRFLSQVKDTNGSDRLVLAMAFLYTSRGIPCLYYGTAQGFNGKTDPNDREDMFAGHFKDPGTEGKDSFDMTQPLYLWARALNNFRRIYRPLRLGTQRFIYSEANGPGLLVYSRSLGNDEVIVALNTAGEKRTLPEAAVEFARETKWMEALDTNEIVEGPIVMPRYSAKIFVHEDAWKQLDPMVTAISPEHDARDVTTNTAIIVQFSQPMNKKTVEAEFALEPSTPGKFEWETGVQMTFTPKQPFSPGTMVYIRVNDASEHFESRFQTAGAP